MKAPRLLCALVVLAILMAILPFGCSRPSDSAIQVAVRKTLTALAPNDLSAAAQTDVASIATATPAPVATLGPPPPIEILSHRSYAQVGMLMIVGEVRNNTAITVSYVFIYATLYDKEGKVVGTGIGAAAIESIPPGGKSPFQVISSEWTGFDHYTLQVQSP